MTVIEHLAKWGAEEAPREHSKGARDVARHAVEDVIACIIAGSNDLGASNVRKMVFASESAGPGTVIGEEKTVLPQLAALANGAAGHALDYDDTFLPGANHASSVLVSALLALGEQSGASGADLIDAYLVGLELQFAVASGVMRSHYDFGWHSTSTIGCIGAAGACARLLKLDAKRFAHALSLGTSMASGCKVQFGSMAKPLHAGLAAQRAIEAAQLAAAGVEGRLNALEGGMGFLELFGGKAPAGWGKNIEKLGAPLAAESRGLMFKRYPCCGSTHRVLDAFFELKAQEKFDADDVESINTLIGYGNSRNLMYTNPVSEMEARFSMQYCLAVALIDGAPKLSHFTPESVKQDKYRRLFGLTTVTSYDPADEQKNVDLMRPHVINVKLKNGRTLERARDLPVGTLKYPFSPEDRKAKFDDCCKSRLDKASSDKLFAAINNIESEQQLSRFTGLLRFGAKTQQASRTPTFA
jgi:2-methylcitrate dehydratase PrpD